jgi:RimJ/RimL family protein N-acetyltransferase
MASTCFEALFSYDFAMVTLPAPAQPLTDGVVTLRRFTLDDVGGVTMACQDPEIPRWTASIPEPYEEHHAQEWISMHDRFWAEEGRAAFAFCDAATRELFGSISLEVGTDRRSASIGYWAAPWARNRGATTRAVRLVCTWGFESLGIESVELMTVVGNVASERVAAKAGFVLVQTIERYKLIRSLDPNARYNVKHWVLRRDRHVATA